MLWLRNTPPACHPGTGKALLGLSSCTPSRPHTACPRHPPSSPTPRPLVRRRPRLPTAAAAAAWWAMAWWISPLPTCPAPGRPGCPRAPRWGCQPSAGGRPARGRSCAWGPWQTRSTRCAITCPPSTASGASPSPKYRPWSTPSSTSANSPSSSTASSGCRAHQERLPRHAQGLYKQKPSKFLPRQSTVGPGVRGGQREGRGATAVPGTQCWKVM